MVKYASEVWRECEYGYATAFSFNKILRLFFYANGQNSAEKSTRPQTVVLSAASKNDLRIFVKSSQGCVPILTFSPLRDGYLTWGKEKGCI